MYESPINQILGEIQITYENECIKAVQSCGFDVNKEELKKALLYDREQYDNGFRDGHKDGYEKALDDILDLMKAWSSNIQKIRGSSAFFTFHDIARQIELLRKVD